MLKFTVLDMSFTHGIFSEEGLALGPGPLFL